MKTDEKRTVSQGGARGRASASPGRGPGPSHLSEGLSFVLLSSILSNLLQSGGPLGPLLHFDQTGQQTHQQEENQQAQQGDDGHVQRLQLVRFTEARRGTKTGQ